jgi:bacterioferritin (cytochrome b1)
MLSRLVQLESLGKLRDVKSKTQGLTLLHYLALELASESKLLTELKALHSKVHEVSSTAPVLLQVSNGWALGV